MHMYISHIFSYIVFRLQKPAAFEAKVDNHFATRSETLQAGTKPHQAHLSHFHEMIDDIDPGVLSISVRNLQPQKNSYSWNPGTTPKR